MPRKSINRLGKRVEAPTFSKFVKNCELTVISAIVKKLVRTETAIEIPYPIPIETNTLYFFATIEPTVIENSGSILEYTIPQSHMIPISPKVFEKRLEIGLILSRLLEGLFSLGDL